MVTERGVRVLKNNLVPANYELQMMWEEAAIPNYMIIMG